MTAALELVAIAVALIAGLRATQALRSGDEKQLAAATAACAKVR